MCLPSHLSPTELFVCQVSCFQAWGLEVLEQLLLMGLSEEASAAGGFLGRGLENPSTLPGFIVTSFFFCIIKIIFDEYFL